MSQLLQLLRVHNLALRLQSQFNHPCRRLSLGRCRLPEKFTTLIVKLRHCTLYTRCMLLSRWLVNPLV